MPLLSDEFNNDLGSRPKQTRFWFPITPIILIGIIALNLFILKDLLRELQEKNTIINNMTVSIREMKKSKGTAKATSKEPINYGQLVTEKDRSSLTKLVADALE
tara:strand:- start:608 stop:919 length:312 start_codon:yes stop_codon:yes gene_type:complete